MKCSYNNIENILFKKKSFINHKKYTTIRKEIFYLLEKFNGNFLWGINSTMAESSLFIVRPRLLAFRHNDR